MIPTGRHAERRTPANDPFMSMIVGALLLLLVLVCLLAGM
jgi:hypothetical protein